MLDWILVFAIGLIAIAIVGLLIWVFLWATVPSLRSQRTPQVVSSRSTVGNTAQTMPPMAETGRANETALPPPTPTIRIQPTPTSAPSPSPIAVPASEETESVVAKRILTKQEFAFFWNLFSVFKDCYYIFPQILLRELITAKKNELPDELRGMWKDGIADFVLADLTTLEAVAVIELDDPTHQTADAQARDQRKNRFVHYAGIPLLRVPSGQKWNMRTIRQDLEREVALARRSNTFLEPEERELFRALRETWDQVFIFPKVSLRQAMQRIEWLPVETYKELHDATVTFLLAHPKSLGTRLVVELDDGNVRDSKKAELLTLAKIPWIAVARAQWSDKTQLRELLRRHLAN